MAIVQVTVVPIGTGSTSVSPYVAKVHKLLQTTDVTYHLTPMGTVLEGPLPRLMEVIQKMHEVPFEQGADRVMTLINIDDRRDKEATAMGKIASVEQKLKG